jgi:hypothetical protein
MLSRAQLKREANYPKPVKLMCIDQSRFHKLVWVGVEDSSKGQGSWSTKKKSPPITKSN